MTDIEVEQAAKLAATIIIRDVSWTMLVGAILLMAIVLLLCALIWAATTFDLTSIEWSKDKPWLKEETND